MIACFGFISNQIQFVQKEFCDSQKNQNDLFEELVTYQRELKTKELAAKQKKR